jgi:uncharacterized protein DUF4412
MRAFAISVAIILLTVSICAASQGLTIVAKMTRDDGTTTTTTNYIAEDHARWSGGGEGEVILDAKAGEMIMLNNSKKTYSVITKKDIEAMAARMQEQMNSPEMKRAQEAMKNLPPEQRQRMEAAMGSMMTMNVEKIGTTHTIAGYKCEDWLVTMGQMTKTVQCMSTDVKFPPQAWTMYRDFADSMKSLMGAMGPMKSNMDSMMEQMKKMKGIPLSSKTTMTVMGHTSVSSTEITDIKNGSIPDSAWQIPAGYTKVENEMTKSMARRR